MSTLKVDAIRHNSATSDAITTAADGTCTAKITSVGGAPLSHRNKVINGAMTVSQRNGTSAVQLSASEQYIIDRFKNDTGSSFDMKADASQSTDTPDGFQNSLKLVCDGVSTPTGGHNGGISSFLEGRDVQDFGFGTSGAKPITVSFYAKSAAQNANDTYSFMIAYSRNSDATRTQQTRNFTVTASWQRFSFTFQPTGQAQSEAIKNNTSNYGIQLFWSLAAGPDDLFSEVTTWTARSALTGITGQNNFFDASGNEFYLTGVQLEVGDTATSFEHRSFGDELARCQRYFYRHGDLNSTRNYALMGNGMIGHNGSTDTGKIEVVAPVRMRQQPTVSVIGTDSFIIHTGGGETGTSDMIGTLGSGGLWTAASSDINFWIDFGRTSGGSPNRGVACIVYANNNGANLGFSAEL